MPDKRPERKMIRCFMNGKSCIYERDVDEILEQRQSPHEKRAFVIMPFGEQLDVLYQWEIAPFLRNGGQEFGELEYKCTPERADDVRQVGFIICEKICKKIQEADYVVADVTFDNPNVFYELGLATALRRKIIPLCSEELAAKRQDELRRMFGIGKLMPYRPFDILEARISNFVWAVDEPFLDFEQMSGDNVVVLHDSTHQIKNTRRYQQTYDFGALCRTAVGTAVSSIFSKDNVALKPELRLYDESRLGSIRTPGSVDLAGMTYRDVINACRHAACVLIDVSSESAIANFFWLGYIHGIGGSAVPVNSYSADESDKQRTTAFDIRALWHISFEENHPADLLGSLVQILEHIYLRKARYLYRHSFWSEILKDNRVSVFLGSLYLEELGRNTIGDWDYRTAAEITNYLSASKETMKVTLGSPLPKREGVRDKAYIEWLQGQLTDNTIIVASSDVNDLTEVALARILGVPPFESIPDTNKTFTGYIAYKKYAKPARGAAPETAFYVRDTGEPDSRGFLVRRGSMKWEITEEHAYPTDRGILRPRRQYGQLVVARNPFAPGKWIVIISGLSGPATFGIAQMLTGCMYEEFTVNDLSDIDRHKIETEIGRYWELATSRVSPTASRQETQVPYDALSEVMLEELLGMAAKSGGETNSLIAVDVYYPPQSTSHYSNDERKVVGWEFVNLKEELRMPWNNPNGLKCQL